MSPSTWSAAQIPKASQPQFAFHQRWLPGHDARWGRPRRGSPSGVNVSPIEIEEQVQRWGRLGTCAVMGLPHPDYGQIIVLCAERMSGDHTTADEITNYLRQQLAPYKVPRHVEFFDEREIPVTISSKVNLPQLRDQLVERLLLSDVDSAWKEHLSKHPLTRRSAR